MPKRLDRRVEVRVQDNRGKRVEGAKLTFFANNELVATIPSTRDKDPTIQFKDHKAVIGVDIEYPENNPTYIDSVSLGTGQNEWVFEISPEHFRPKIFIGSSSEGHNEALIIQAGLRHYADAVVWSQGVFGLSRGTLETLVDKANDFTHAVLILTPDDMLFHRGNDVISARDNVLFELGLFMGVLGRDRTFIVAEESVRLPTDLSGISIADFQRGQGINPEANLGPSITKLLGAMGLLMRKQLR